MSPGRVIVLPKTRHVQDSNYIPVYTYILPVLYSCKLNDKKIDILILIQNKELKIKLCTTHA